MKSSKNPETSSNLPDLSQSKYLPLEICTQILSTLPVKTLVKFRCVCKSWCSVIDNPDFVHMHFQFSRINFGDNNKLLVTLEGRNGNEGSSLRIRDAQTFQVTDEIFSKSEWYRKFHIISCNGLLLVRQYIPKELELWNPSIRKSLILPPCPYPPYPPLLYLLGFAPDSQDYKVVAIREDQENENRYYLAVYTLRSRQWTVRNDPLNVSYLNITSMAYMFESLATAVFFRGASYWLGVADFQRYAVKFDFDKENITFLELPFSLDETYYSRRFLFLLGGSLAVFSMSEVAFISIWVLEQDNRKGPWILWFSGQSSCDGYQMFFKEYILRKNLFYFESDGGYFVYGNKAYNIRSCQVQELNKSMSSYFKLKKYFESLVLFKEHGARDLRSSP